MNKKYIIKITYGDQMLEREVSQLEYNVAEKGAGVGVRSAPFDATLRVGGSISGRVEERASRGQPKYYIYIIAGGVKTEREVSVEDYCTHERSLGFHPKNRTGDWRTTPATGGFGNLTTGGRIDYGY